MSRRECSCWERRSPWLWVAPTSWKLIFCLFKKKTLWHRKNDMQAFWQNALPRSEANYLTTCAMKCMWKSTCEPSVPVYHPVSSVCNSVQWRIPCWQFCLNTVPDCLKHKYSPRMTWFLISPGGTLQIEPESPREEKESLCFHRRSVFLSEQWRDLHWSFFYNTFSPYLPLSSLEHSSLQLPPFFLISPSIPAMILFKPRHEVQMKKPFCSPTVYPMLKYPVR